MNSEQHSITKSVILHLLPGLLVIIIFILLTPVLREQGLPSVFTLLIAVTFILIPFELGYLFYLGKKKNGEMSLKGIVLFREKITIWQYIVLAPILIIWGFLIAAFVSSHFDEFLVTHIFFWLPDWFYVDEISKNLANYSKTIIYVTLIFGLIMNGFLGPIVEELYFRGYLLPRISRFKGWAPLINTVLFSLYHFFTPWQNPTRILGVLPMVYVVWWKKNIYLGIFTHCLMNIIATISMIIYVLGKI
jgi:membrane protease YdiL (CAAX protease family)